jgi:hypothetical protein
MHLNELFDEASRIEMYETSKKLFCCMMIEGSSVNTHVLKMIGYIKKLDQLGFVIDHELSVDLVLHSLPKNFLQFIMNYHMNKLDSTLFNMLKTAKGILKKKKSQDLLVQSSKMFKKKDKKNKGVVSKGNKPNEASRKIRALVIIVARKNIGRGIAWNALQP